MAPGLWLDSPRHFAIALGATLVANLVDAAGTLHWTHEGLATEANPLLARLVMAQPGAFILAKVALVGLAALLLWRLREHRTARVAFIPAALLYAFVVGQHMGFAIVRGWSG